MRRVKARVEGKNINPHKNKCSPHTRGIPSKRMSLVIESWGMRTSACVRDLARAWTVRLESSLQSIVYINQRARAGAVG